MENSLSRGTVLPSLLRHRRLVEVLLENPKREFTIRELALESRVSYATTWRLVDLLRELGALRIRKVGASQALTLNEGSPMVREIRQLAALSLFPHPQAARRFARAIRGLAGVRTVVLFGGTARGTANRSSDVDVAVVVSRRTREVQRQILRAAELVQDETGLRIVPVLVVPSELRKGTGFARSLRNGEVLFEGI